MHCPLVVICVGAMRDIGDGNSAVNARPRKETTKWPRYSQQAFLDAVLTFLISHYAARCRASCDHIGERHHDIQRTFLLGCLGWT